MDIKLLALYFVMGGLAVALTTYFGSRGQGLLAAFVGVFPTVTVITFTVIYLKSGITPVVSYAKGMLILLPPWTLDKIRPYALVCSGLRLAGLRLTAG